MDQLPEQPPAGTAKKSARRVFVRCLVGACWLYALVVVAAWALLGWADLWGPATILMFGPRLLFALPLALLAPLALAARRGWLLLLLGLAGLVVAGPLSGGCVPWRQFLVGPPQGFALRLLTCNMHYRPMDARPLEELILENNPDVVVLQEWSEDNHSALLSSPRWHTSRKWGLFLASRHPIVGVERLGVHSGKEQALVTRYALATPGGIVTLFSLHLASPRQGIYEAVRERDRGLPRVEGNIGLRWQQSRFIAGEAEKSAGPVLLAGDFNTPRESAIFRDVWRDYRDAFTESGWGWGFTFFGGRTFVRIDHILMSRGWQCRKCWVGPSVGSPHLPVLADLVLSEKAAQDQ